jgi:hypothetical protein
MGLTSRRPQGEGKVYLQSADPQQLHVKHDAITRRRVGSLTTRIKPIGAFAWHDRHQRPGTQNVRRTGSRRQMGVDKIPGGSSRALRLDPFTLPVRFAAEDAAADQAIRHIELHRERVVLRRAVRGMRIAVNLPLTVYLGLMVRRTNTDHQSGGEVAIVLEHRDPALSVPLFVAFNDDDVAAISHAWARVLDVSLLGSHPERRGGLWKLAIRMPIPRRRRGTLKQRRPSILLRRKPARMSKEPTVYREYEIIARH